MSNIAPPGFNYAKAEGINSVAGAVVFAVLYLPLFLLYLKQAIARPTYVFVVLSLFCAIRIAAFTMRAVIAGVVADQENLNLVLAFEILYDVGFFTLLYSAYTLVLDRGLLSDAPLPSGPLFSLLRRRMLFRVVLIVAVALGITGAVQSATGSSASTVNMGNTLHKVSTIIFLILSILVVLQTIILARSQAMFGAYKTNNTSFGHVYGTQILGLISLLLLVREGFFTATNSNLTTQNTEHFWYPFAAVPELFAVALFAAPGLVPSRAELPT